MRKKAIEIRLNEPEPVLSPSEKKKEFEDFMELLKKQNPMKYDLNEAALKEKLGKL